MKRFLLLLVLCAGSLGVSLGCNSVLGIDQAMLETSASSGSMASSDSGGSGASSGDEPDAATLYTLSCDNYCNLMSTYCTAGAQADNTEYLSIDAGTSCTEMCNEFEVSGEVISPSEEPNDTNTLNCRVWHANAARLGDPHTHCPHAGPLGGTVCDNNSDPCEPFCRMDVDFCTGDAAAYTSYQDCLNACRPNAAAGYAGFPYEVSSDPEVTDLALQFQAGSNTLNCRIYHLENYLRTGDPIHCSHTSANGNGVCTTTP